MSAAYTPGIPQLGIPNIQSTDASMGVTNPGYRPDDKGATAMPSAILVGSSFNPRLAFSVGEAIAKEARSRAAAHRESDLLAFQIAIEKSNPGSIMGGYNKINDEHASGNN